MRRFFTVLFLLALVPFVSVAEIDREVRKSVKIYFRQGSAVIDENYMGNGATLAEFASEVKTYCADSTAKFRQIRVKASASPEGTQKANDRVARARAAAITAWISREISVKLEYAVERTHIDWEELTKLVEQTAEVPQRDEVLSILHTIPEHSNNKGKVFNERYFRLTQLGGGVPYQWIEENLFPRVRYAAARAEFWWELDPRIDIESEDKMKFGAEGGAGAIRFKKNVEDDVLPTATSDASWITALTPQVNNITFDVAPNPYKEARTATIVVEGYGKKHTVTVSQAATDPVLTITSPSPINFPAEGGNGKVTFSRNVKDDTLPTVKTEAEWLTLAQPTVDSLSFTVAQNVVEQPRTANISVECYNQKYDVTVNQDAAVVVKPEEKRPFYMSLKTNMLFDLIGIPNLGAEFYLGKNFSIAANWNYAWWNNNNKHWYWRYYGGDLAVRWWFGRASKVKPLQGHHIGVYGQVMTYDFEWFNRGIMGGDPTENIFGRMNQSVGLEYGYSLPIAKRLNLDFTLGVGYHWGIFHEYTPIDGHYVWQVTKRRRYFGPTKLEVSLVWLIGRGNYNERKEGKR